MTLCWRWIPAFAGMTTTYSFPSSLPSFPSSLPSFPSSLPSFPASLPSFPRRRESKLTHHQNHTARCLPGLVMPEKSVTLCWRWIPAFAGMTTTYSFPSSLPSFPASLPSFPASLPSFPSSLPSFPRRRESKLTHHQNHTARCLPGLVIPEKSVTLCWPWIPAFAGMTTTYSFPSSLPSFPASLPSFPASLPSFPSSLPSFPRRRESKLTHHQNHTAR